jgi:hypothetical protein
MIGSGSMKDCWLCARSSSACWVIIYLRMTLQLTLDRVYCQIDRYY